MKVINEFKTSDIKISTDSTGAMTSEHYYQGILIESTYSASRADFRRDSVDVLKDIKNEKT